MDKNTFNRMLQEFQDLNVRVDKCRAFILNEDEFSKLDALNRDLLIAQLKAMETYLSILSVRLGTNGTPENMADIDSMMNQTVEEDQPITADSILGND